MRFKVRSLQLFEPKIPKESFTLITWTPVIIRIPRWRCEEYGITPKKPYNYVYWRKDYSIEPFMKQLEDNLRKKYSEYYRFEVAETPILERLIFKKQISTRLGEHGEEGTVIATSWEFQFGHSEEGQRELLQHGLETGFGERNSLGFGFINIKQP
jgi:CRISPR-associated endoribonuclease Cas6